MLVAGTEDLYRQIPPNGNPPFYQSQASPKVHPVTFRPGSSDLDGLSMLRAACRSLQWSAYRVEQPDKRFRVAQLPVLLLSQLAHDVGFNAFDVQVTPDQLDHRFGEPFAHCVLVQINRPDYDRSPEVKKRIREWTEKVVQVLTDERIHGPFDPPDEASTSTYRP